KCLICSTESCRRESQRLECVSDIGESRTIEGWARVTLIFRKQFSAIGFCFEGKPDSLNYGFDRGFVDGLHPVLRLRATGRQYHCEQYKSDRSKNFLLHESSFLDS